jgi:hypothetical protein
MAYKLSTYSGAAETAARSIGYKAHDVSTHRTGKGIIATKVDIRDPKNLDLPTDQLLALPDADRYVARRDDVKAKMVAELTAMGYTVLKTANTWFDYGRGGMGADAVTFYMQPRED